MDLIKNGPATPATIEGCYAIGKDDYGQIVLKQYAMVVTSTGPRVLASLEIHFSDLDVSDKLLDFAREAIHKSVSPIVVPTSKPRPS